MLVVGFPEYAAQAEALARALGADFRAAGLHRFPDGESRVTLPLPVSAHTVMCRSLHSPNDKLVELLLAAETARELGARRITLVAPYLSYMRQDTAFEPGQAVSQRIVGGWLARAFDDVITVDPHLHRTATLGEAVPARCAIAASAAGAIGHFLAGRASELFIVGPDEESRQWVEAVAGACGADFAVARKVRHGDRSVSVRLDATPLDGRTVAVVDDVASTGHTLAETVRVCRALGARRVAVVVTHGLFVDGALALLEQAGASDVWSTDSVPHSTNAIALFPSLAQALLSLPPTLS